MKNTLLVGDLHLTDSARDEYRWQVFEQVLAFTPRPQRVVFLGDLTDAKDHHPGRLVNRIVEKIHGLSKRMQVDIVRGNHDGLNPDWPFFKFLGLSPPIHFYAALSELHGSRMTLVLPHSRDPDRDWATVSLVGYKTVLLHQTFRGAVAENGVEVPASPLPKCFDDFNGRAYAGDIHVPQKVGRITYVGAPYAIRFGDDFSPRMVYMDEKGQQHSIALENTRKLMLDVKSSEEFKSLLPFEGDVQLKIRVHFEADDLGRWARERDAILKLCAKHKIDVVMIEAVKQAVASMRRISALHTKPGDVLTAYVKAKKVKPKLAKVGEELLSQVAK